MVYSLKKMIYYKLVKTTIHAAEVVEVIINIVVKNYNILELFITLKIFLFTSKLMFLLCYFFGIKQNLSTIFYS